MHLRLNKCYMLKMNWNVAKSAQILKVSETCNGEQKNRRRKKRMGDVCITYIKFSDKSSNTLILLIQFKECVIGKFLSWQKIQNTSCWDIVEWQATTKLFLLYSTVVSTPFSKRLNIFLKSHGMVSLFHKYSMLTLCQNLWTEKILKRLKDSIFHFSLQSKGSTPLCASWGFYIHLHRFFIHSLSQLVWTYAWSAHAKLICLQTLPRLIFTILQKLQGNLIFVHPDLSFNASEWEQRMNVGTECSQRRVSANIFSRPNLLCSQGFYQFDQNSYFIFYHKQKKITVNIM